MGVEDPLGLMVAQLRVGSPDAAALGELFRSFCTAVPCDTSLIRAGLSCDPSGPLRGAHPNEVTAGFCASGTGATCMGLSATFAAVAQRCGFHTRLRAAYAENDLPGLPSHVACVVDTDQGPALCDPALFHLTPVLLPSTHNQRVFSGPAWSPVYATNTEGVLRYTAQRPCSRDELTYTLGEHMTLAELLSVYDTVGRLDVHMGPYVTLIHSSTLVGVGLTHATVKGQGGVRRVTLPDGPQRNTFLAAITGRSATAVAALTSQFKPHQVPLTSS